MSYSVKRNPNGNHWDVLSDGEAVINYLSFATASTIVRRVALGEEFFNVVDGLFGGEYDDYDDDDYCPPPTCWVCDGYHAGRGCPIDARSDAIDGFDPYL